jgi:surface protein
MKYMFGADGIRFSYFNGDLSSWNVAKVTNMEYMFNNVRTFNGNISSWDVGKVTSMVEIFGCHGCYPGGQYSFNGDLSSWDVGKVTSMVRMFAYARAFNCNISS